MAWREKIDLDFLMCVCAGYSVAIFPGKYVHIYYGRAAQNGCGSSVGSWRLESTVGIYYLG